MKYLALLAAIAIIYLVFARQAPVAPVQQAIKEAEAVTAPAGAKGPAPAAGSAIKQPLDRTKAVLEQVRQRNGDGEF